MTPTVRIVPLEKDREQGARDFILDILANEYGLPPKRRLDLEDMSAYYRGGGSNFWVARAEDAVVGTIGLKTFENGIGNVKRFYVTHALRGSGVGSSLFSTMLEHAKTNAVSELYLSTSEGMKDAVPFYEHRGFHRIEALPVQISPSDDTIYLGRTV